MNVLRLIKNFMQPMTELKINENGRTINEQLLQSANDLRPVKQQQ